MRCGVAVVGVPGAFFVCARLAYTHDIYFIILRALAIPIPILIAVCRVSRKSLVKQNNNKEINNFSSLRNSICVCIYVCVFISLLNLLNLNWIILGSSGCCLTCNNSVIGRWIIYCFLGFCPTMWNVTLRCIVAHCCLPSHGCRPYHPIEPSSRWNLYIQDVV